MVLWVRLFWVELRRGIKLWWSYRLDALSGILLWTVAFPLIILMFDSVTGSYGKDRQMDSLVGFLIWNLCMDMLTSTANSISRETQEGTLENVLLSPIGPVALFSIRMAALQIIYVLETLALGLVLLLLLQLPLAVNPAALLIVVLTVFAVGGVALALGGLAMIYKNVASTVSVVALLALFFTGAIVPLNDLGFVFSILKYVLPTTWGIDAFRQSLSGSTMSSFWSDGTFLGLGIQAIIFIAIGAYIFRRGFRRARLQGSLARY